VRTDDVFSDARVAVRGLEGPGAVATVRSDRTGLPVVSLGRTITSEDVRLLDDDPP
jgi:hypothetical protein